MAIKIKSLEKIANTYTEQRFIYKDLALDLNDKFLQMGKEAIVEAANSTGVTGFVKDIFAAVKDINWMRKMTTGISSVDNPLTATAYRTLTTALAKAREKIQIMADKLKTANDMIDLLNSS